MRRKASDPEPGLLVVGHRGAPIERIENTMPSFEEALRQGAGALECDVRASSDGVSLLFHDRTLARLAGRDVPVEDLTSNEARRLRLRAPRRPDGRIAPLVSLLRLVRRTGVPLAIEAKSPQGPRGAPQRERIARAADAVARALRAVAPRRERRLLISFDLDLLAALRSEGTGLELGAIFDRPPALAARKRTAGLASLLVLHRGLLASPSVARWAARLALPVWVYPIDSRRAAEAAIEHARRRGVRLEALISNRPGRLRSRLHAPPRRGRPGRRVS